MDFRKQRVAVGLAVFVLLLGLTVWAVVSRRPSSEPSADAEAALPKIPVEDLTEIEIQKPGEKPVKLTRSGEAWRMTAPVSADADQGSITAILDSLKELKVKGVAATLAANHAKLEVDSAKGVRVILKAKDRTVADLVLGAYRGGNTMVREQGKAAVLSVGGSIRYAFAKAPKDFRDRVIVNVPPEQLTAMTLQNKKGTVRFVNSPSGWALAPGVKPIDHFDAGKVRALASSLAQLRASDFAEPNVDEASAGTSNAATVVTLERASDAGSSQVVLRLGKSLGAEGAYVVSAGKPVVYVVSKYIVDQLEAGRDQFQLPPDAGVAPPPEPGPEAPSPGGGEQQIPPEVMRQLQEQLRNRGGHP